MRTTSKLGSLTLQLQLLAGRARGCCGQHCRCHQCRPQCGTCLRRRVTWSQRPGDSLAPASVAGRVHEDDGVRRTLGIFALRESPVSATLGAQAVVAGSDPQKTATIQLHVKRSNACRSSSLLTIKSDSVESIPLCLAIGPLAKLFAGASSNQAVSSQVAPNHWRFVGDDGLVLVTVVGEHGGNVPETLIDPVGLQKFGGRSAEHVALVGGAKDKLFEVEVDDDIKPPPLQGLSRLRSACRRNRSRCWILIIKLHFCERRMKLWSL